MMKTFTLTELEELLAVCQRAIQFAQDHRVVIESRPHVYTLYGPPSDLVGACAPCRSLTPIRERKLMRSTSRKDYMIYELDEKYMPIRNIRVADNRLLYSFHHFDYEGFRFAFNYGKYPQAVDRARIFGTKYENGKPVLFVAAQWGSLCALYFEYLSNERMEVSDYNMKAKKSRIPRDIPLDWEAPFGTENSPVQVCSYEDSVCYTDFSKWFEQK